jgi:selenocysteine-specific elongation factor
MRVVGTAGHVDHGKSALVQAITGINPDRLAEEQRRQMTIDLGFAWLTLPDGESVGIVDVPGHRDFIENMLAGVGGIDAVLFVVAADEGVMPQTEEHLAILDLLDISRGVVALTKIDVVDEDWLDLVEEEIALRIKESSLRESPIVRVSAKTGQGLDTLVSTLQDTLRDTPKRKNRDLPRLPIDRVFSIAGFGTVVTGTLLDGAFEVGETVQIQPGGSRGRIRGLQTHKEKIERAFPGSRVAVNISGIDVDAIERGDVAIEPGTYKTTRMIDVSIRLLNDLDHLLRHNEEVKLYIGAAQRIARLRLLGSDTLHPGEEGLLQLLLSDPIITSRGDRFILRRPSPSATLGGGVVIDAHPKRRHRLKDQAVIEQLKTVLRGSPADVLQRALERMGPTTLAAGLMEAGLSDDEAEEAIHHLSATGSLFSVNESPLTLTADGWVIDKYSWTETLSTIRKALGDFHLENTLRAGMPTEELRSKMGVDTKLATQLLERAEKEGIIVIGPGYVSLQEHRIDLNANQRKSVDRLLSAFEAAPFAPPSVKEANQAVGEDLLRYMLESGLLIQVSGDVVFTAEAYEEMVEKVKIELQKNGVITVAEVRDNFQTSRKFALALMEHLDSIKLTVRVGDERRLV